MRYLKWSGQQKLEVQSVMPSEGSYEYNQLNNIDGRYRIVRLFLLTKRAESCCYSSKKKF
jgi:hypothetical protein